MVLETIDVMAVGLVWGIRSWLDVMTYSYLCTGTVKTNLIYNLLVSLSGPLFVKGPKRSHYISRLFEQLIHSKDKLEPLIWQTGTDRRLFSNSKKVCLDVSDRGVPKL